MLGISQRLDHTICVNSGARVISNRLYTHALKLSVSRGSTTPTKYYNHWVLNVPRPKLYNFSVRGVTANPIPPKIRSSVLLKFRSALTFLIRLYRLLSFSQLNDSPSIIQISQTSKGKMD